MCNTQHYRSHSFRLIVCRFFEPLCVTYILAYGGIRLARELQHPIPVLNNWLTDFLFVPVTAHIALSVIRYCVLKNQHYRYPLSYLLFIAGYASIVFEWLLPLISAKAIADIFDVFAYFAGAFFYYFAHQKTALSRNQ